RAAVRTLQLHRLNVLRQCADANVGQAPGERFEILKARRIVFNGLTRDVPGPGRAESRGDFGSFRGRRGGALKSPPGFGSIQPEHPFARALYFDGDVFAGLDEAAVARPSPMPLPSPAECELELI